MVSHGFRSLGTLGFVAFLAIGLARCQGCGGSNPSEEEDGSSGHSTTRACTTDDQCYAGEQCIGDVCRSATRLDGGGSSSGSPDGSSLDGGEAADANLAPRGILSLSPSPLVEFGAQRLGTPVSTNVFARNTGNAPLTVLVVYIDNNTSGEFSVEPTGSMNRTLQPDDELILRVTHTPVDGTPDNAQLRVVHSEQGAEPASVDLMATFKGSPQVSITTDLATLQPSITSLDLGQVPLATDVTATLFIRNTGASNSALTLRGLTLTPQTAGFSLEGDTAAGTVLSAFLAQCNTAGQCPATHPACTANICVDTDGVPPDTLVVTVRFAPQQAGLHNAVLTLLHSDGETDGQVDVNLLAEGARGQLLVTPGAIDFGDVFVGRPAERSLTVQNAGNGTLSLEAPSVAGSTDVTLVDAQPIVLAANATVTLTVHLEASAEGAIVATVQLRGADSDPVDVTVTANARLAPSITTDATLAFGGVYVGQTQSRTLLVRNLGPGALRLAAVTTEGAAAARFTVSPGSFPDPLAPLANAADESPNITLSVSYRPVEPPSAFDDVATLVITSDDPDHLRTEVALSGRGIKPVAVVQPPSVAFGGVRLGAAPVTSVVQLFNNGVGPLVLSALQMPAGGPFSVVNPPALPATVELGAPLSLTLQFAPQSAGSASGTFRLTTSDIANPQLVVELSGVGTQGALTPEPTALDFGTVFVGRTATRSFTARNTGDATLTINTAQLSGSSEYRFTTNPAPTTLAPNATATFTVELAPLVEGSPSGTAVLETDIGLQVQVTLSGTARFRPTILAETAVDFGSVDTRAVGTRQVSVRNSGPGVLNLSRVTITGPGAARYSVPPTSFPPLDPLAQPTDNSPALAIAVTYQPVAPTTGNADVAELHIESDDPDTPDHVVALTGLAVHPNVSRSPESLAFGNVKAGTTSASQTVRISSIATTDGSGPLRVTALELPAGSPFNFVNPPALPATVAVNGSLDVAIAFAPTSATAQSATLLIRTNDLDAPAESVGLSGTGVQGVIGVDPVSIDFNEVFHGFSTSQLVTVDNDGLASMDILSASITQTDNAFTIEGFTPATLQPSQSMTFSVRYTPPAGSAFTGTLTITADNGTRIDVPLTGTARPAPSVIVPASLSFGDVYAARSSMLEIPIRNGGPGTLSVRRLTVVGPAAARFSLSPTSFSGTLAPLANLSDPTPKLALNVTYQPLDPPTGTVDQATVEVETDDPNLPVAQVTMTGRGIKPVFAHSPQSIAFGQQTVDAAATPRDITVVNNGYGPLIVTAASLPAGAFSLQVVGTPLPRVLQPLTESLILRVGFTAPSATSYTADLSVTSSDFATPSVVVPLSGSGRPCATRAGTSFVQNGAMCTYSCLANFHDLNGDVNAATSDGCEYACTFQSATDIPDGAFTDADCDGIDGMPGRAIFVATNGANVAVTSGGGTRDTPMLTINYALSQAAANGRDHVYVSEGAYNTETVTIRNGISLYGGYSRANDWKRTSSYVTSVTRGTEVSGRIVAMSGSGITSPTTVANMTVTATGTSSPSVSVYGLHCSSCTGLRLDGMTITSGAAGSGVAGSGTGSGAAGGDGFNGGNGAIDNQNAWGAGGAAGWSDCSRPGGTGGNGRGEANNGYPGANGTVSGAGGGGGGGGGGENGCSKGGDGAPGSAGTAGANGTHGAKGAAGGTIVSGYWVGRGGVSGTGGTNAHGGGGGGGGAGQGGWSCVDGAGSGGGGGGGGGCAAGAGTAGTAGGGSFGLFLVNSTGVLVENSRITSGNGGSGGGGGRAGTGGGGGYGGAGGTCCSTEVGRGGAGGNGGKGGNGGHGGGGAGGDSFAIYRVNTVVSQSANTLVPGSAGGGGFSWGNSGDNGLSGQIN